MHDVIKQYNILSHKFVLTLSYWERLAIATNSLSSMAIFSKEFHAQIIAPYTCLAEL